jgi:hypothetical protein
MRTLQKQYYKYLIKLKHHIAAILLGLFMFPILFQSVHVLWHHTQDCIDACCCKHIDVVSESSSGTIATLEEDCLICNYLITINSFADPVVYRISLPIEKRAFVFLIIQHPLKQVGSFKSPRAPPIGVQA